MKDIVVSSKDTNINKVHHIKSTNRYLTSRNKTKRETVPGVAPDNKKGFDDEFAKFVASKAINEFKKNMKESHDKDELINKDLTAVNDAIKKLKTEKPKLDKLSEYIDAFLKQNTATQYLTYFKTLIKGDNENETSKKIKEYKNELQSYRDVLDNISQNSGQEVILELADLLRGKIPNLEVEQKEKEKDHNDILSELMVARHDLKALLAAEAEKREALLEGVSKVFEAREIQNQNGIADPKIEAIANGYTKILEKEFDGFSDSLKADFKRYGLDKRLENLLLLDSLVEVHGYKKQELTVEMIENENPKVENKIRELIKKTNSIDDKIKEIDNEINNMDTSSDYDEKESAELDKKEIKKEKLTAEFANKFKEIGKEHNKLDILKELSQNIKRDKNFSDNIKPMMYT
jgi:septal ring factor EnvC (AmiA/AmiB activator)